MKNLRVNSPFDPDSESYLKLLAEHEKIRTNRVAGVRTVLVVLSSRGMVFDTESMRQKILQTYRDATIFFQTTLGLPVGAKAPKYVDLLIDFTGPRQRQGWFFARKLRRMARFAVGRNAGLFRSRIYDKIVDEKSDPGQFSMDLLERERQVQRVILGLVGVSVSHQGDTTQDRSHSIALELPAMRRL